MRNETILLNSVNTWKKLKWKFLWLARLGSDILRLRLKENTARLDSNILRLSFCGFGCDSQVYSWIISYFTPGKYCDKRPSAAADRGWSTIGYHVPPSETCRIAATCGRNVQKQSVSWIPLLSVIIFFMSRHRRGKHVECISATHERNIRCTTMMHGWSL